MPRSAKISFVSQYAPVLGSRIHYVEEGNGHPILFLHGNPTSSYLWRNILPIVASSGRCLAPDLIGMGRSDKPDIAYDFEDQYRYLVGFIEALNLTDFTLVLHDWGSALGFHYASQNPSKINGIAFMEAIYRPLLWRELDLKMNLAFRAAKIRPLAWVATSNNIYLKQLLKLTITRKLSSEEVAAYLEPFPTFRSRRPLRAWGRQAPVGAKSTRVSELVLRYQDWLKESPVPKLCLYVTPGLTTNEDGAHWIAANFANTEIVYLGEGIHFIQEDYAAEIGSAVRNWVNGIL